MDEDDPVVLKVFLEHLYSLSVSFMTHRRDALCSCCSLRVPEDVTTDLLVGLILIADKYNQQTLIDCIATWMDDCPCFSADETKTARNYIHMAVAIKSIGGGTLNTSDLAQAMSKGVLYMGALSEILDSDSKALLCLHPDVLLEIAFHATGSPEKDSTGSTCYRCNVTTCRWYSDELCLSCRRAAHSKEKAKTKQ